MDSTKRLRLGQILVLLPVASIILFFLMSAWMAPTINQASEGDFRTIVGVQGTPEPGGVLMFDNSGDQLWKYSNATSIHDVTYLENGSILVTPTIKEENKCGRFPSPCARTGVWVINPEQRKIEYNWTFPVRSDVDSEVHDAEILPSGEILIADMEYERVFTIAPNGTITWQWNASDHYESPDDPTQEDWLHINDVDRIKKGQYLVSVRNANQLLIIDREEGVTEVVNENRDPEVLNHQHNPQYLNDEAILVADSENNRIVELHKVNGTWAVAWELDSAGGMKFDWPRDADRLSNGHTLITDSRNNRVVEVTESGEVIWSQHAGELPYEADRLPNGEPIGGQTYNESGSSTGQVSVPVFSHLYAGLTHIVTVPHWLTVWHLVSVTVAIPIVFVGLLLWKRERAMESKRR